MKRQGFFAAVCAAVALCSGAAFALDLSEVKTLVLNGVDESVIIDMVNQGGNWSADSGDVAELRALGASETLIAAVLTAPKVPPTVYYEQPPTVVAQPPTVVYERAPTYVYPYPYPRRHYFPARPGISFSFGFGGGHHYPRRSYRRWR